MNFSTINRLLGQAQLFDLLVQALTKPPEEILNQTFDQSTNVLHLLASATADTRYGGGTVCFSGLDSYSPDYEKQFNHALPADKEAVKIQP